MNKNYTLSEIFEELKDNYISYITTRDKFKFDSINKERLDIIHNCLYQEPYVEYRARYKNTGNTTEQDIKVDLGDEDLYEFISFDDGLFPKSKGYRLYTHQKQALENPDKHIIVTSGTGSGKTETFFLPVLQNLLKESKEKWPLRGEYTEDAWRFQKNQRDGEPEERMAAVRALILYPLNALVEDQLVRLRKTLDSEDARNFLKEKRKNNLIYFGRYNSSTPVAGTKDDETKQDELKRELKVLYENQNVNYNDNQKGRYYNQRLDGAEMYSRWDMQELPPDILITNYSMLNIMLMRKIENNIFEKTKKWLEADPNNKFQLVLDELHSYRGTAGTEIAYLIRLFLSRIGLTPDSPQLQILASSASLGDNNEDSKKFLCEFFGCTDKDKFEIINGDLILPDDEGNTPKQKELMNCFYQQNKGESQKRYLALPLSKLKELSGIEDENELGRVLSENNIAVRAHYFFKNFRGLWACSNPNCSELKKYADENNIELEPERKVGKIYSEPKGICSCGSRVLELLICQNCGMPLLGGYINKDESSDNSTYLFPEAVDLEKMPEFCTNDKTAKNYWVIKPDTEEIPESVQSRSQLHNNKISWVPSNYRHENGEIREIGRRAAAISQDFNSYIFKLEEKNGGQKKPSAIPPMCPYCEDDWSTNDPEKSNTVIKPIMYGFQKINQLMADKLLSIQNSKSLVLFTDSRQDAAKLSAGVEMDHYRDTLRQAVYQAINSSTSEILLYDRYCANDFEFTGFSDEEKKAAKNVQKQKSYEKIRDLIQKHYDGELGEERERQYQELIINLKNSLTSFDTLKQSIREALLQKGINPGGYLYNDYNNYKWHELYDWSDKTFSGKKKNLTELAERFEIKIENGFEYELLSTLFNSRRGIEALGLGVVGCARSKLEGKYSEDTIRAVNAFVRYMGERKQHSGTTSKYKIDLKKKIKKFAELIGMSSSELENAITESCVFNQTSGILRAENIYIKPYDVEKDGYYICPKCRKVYLEPFKNKCCNEKCHGTELVKGSNLDKDIKENYYYGLSKNEITRLVSEELTAQTDKNDARDRQRKFQDIYIENKETQNIECKIKDSIEILSVTTTMEAGVDIGSLEAIMLSNMPPERFNYQQRVGRAGRNDSDVAIALTVCRNRNHDAFYFQHPEKITNDKTVPPYLDMGSPSIFKRMLAKEVLRRYFFENPPVAKQDENGKSIPLKDSVHGEFGETEDWAFIKEQGYLQNWINANQPAITEIIESMSVNTAFASRKSEFLDFVNNDLVDEIDKCTQKSGNDILFLSEALANYGLLPMFGFPTRTRDLILGKIETEYEKEKAKSGKSFFKGFLKDRTVNRDLDIAISQFAPKAETIIDKKIYISAGIISSTLGDKEHEKKYAICKSCKNIKELRPTDNQTGVYCDVCGNECEIQEVVQPENFFSFSTYDCFMEYAPALDYDGNFDFAPYSQRPQINQKEINLNGSFENCKYLKETELVQIVSINDNLGQKYKLHLMETPNLYVRYWVSPEAVEIYKEKSNRQNLKVHTPEEHVEKEVSLISAKMTDVFLAQINKIPENIDLSYDFKKVYTKTAYYSLAFLLRDAAARILDVDKKEIEAGLRAVKDGDITVAQIFLSDALENGAGYSKWLSNEDNFKSVLKQLKKGGDIYETLVKKEHREKCTGSCYDCMQDYSNRFYHGLLDWRLGLDMVEMLTNKDFVPSLDTEYWQEVKQAAINAVEANKAQHTDLKDIEYEIVHPLSPRKSSKELRIVNILDAIKRPNEMLRQLKNSEGMGSQISDVSTEKKSDFQYINDCKSNLCDEDYESIFCIIEDEFKEEEEQKFLQTLMDEKLLEGKEKPCLEAEFEDKATREKYTADLYWEKSEVMLFLKPNQKAYEKAKQAGAKAFYPCGGIDIEEFTSAIVKD